MRPLVIRFDTYRANNRRGNAEYRALIPAHTLTVGSQSVFLHSTSCCSKLGYNGKQPRYNLRAIHCASHVDEPH